VVRGGDGEVWPANLETALAQTLESLGRGDFVDQVEVYVKELRCSGFFTNYVTSPDFLGKG
jgi:hypothetical protein